MALRKWAVRSLVFTLAAGLAAAGLAYHHWTNPTVVRQRVLARLAEYLPGASISLESAHLRLLGGISVSELRLTRRDDPVRGEFAYFPAGTIYHDKEELLNGRLAV